MKNRSVEALLIVNETSGTAQDALGTVSPLLEAAGLRLRCFLPRKPSEIPDLIRAHAPEAGVVIIGGGDGTFNGAAEALRDAERPLGILPLGTANDLARTLGIPLELEGAAKVIVAGQRRRIDLGLVNGRPFFNVASIGLSAQIARFHRGERKRLLGLLSYPLSWIDAYKSQRPFVAGVTCDGETRKVRCLQLTIGNGRHYGGGMTVKGDAEIDDGWLDAYYIKPLGAAELFGLLPALRSGRFANARHIKSFRGREIEVETSQPLDINVDGELVGRTPAHFRIQPKVLEVFAPDLSEGIDTGTETLGGASMSVLRSDFLVALNDVTVACAAAASQYRHAADVCEDSTLATELRAVADARTASAEALAEVMRQHDDIPGKRAEEVELVEAAATHLKAAVSADTAAVLQADCAAKDDSVAQAAATAIGETQDEALRRQLETLRQDASQRAKSGRI